MIRRHVLQSVLVSSVLLVASSTSAAPSAPSGEPAPGRAALSRAVSTRAESVRLRAPDGAVGPASYWGDPPRAEGGFFPLAVWFESVLYPEDIELDRQAGLNTYLEVTNDSDLDLIREAGMRVLATVGAGDARLSGYLLPDEVDMWAGAGTSAWTGNYPGEGDICDPVDSKCGYDVLDRVMAEVPAERYVYGQFGKGVMMWQTTDEARAFVNTYPDAVSADLYWFTDPNICGFSEGGFFFGTETALSPRECRRPENYGMTVERMRSLVQPPGSKPVWVFVELGHPFEQDDAPTITPAQMRRAVWSGLIHGARGVAYFNHSFGGSCFSFHLLRDECGTRIRPAVTALNRQIRDNAQLLNAPFVDGLLTRRGAIDVSAKLYGGSFHVIVGPRGNGAVRGTVRLACGRGRAAVNLETGRRTAIRRGRFSVRLPASQAVRIYRIARGNTCGLSDLAP